MAFTSSLEASTAIRDEGAHVGEGHINVVAITIATTTVVAAVVTVVAIVATIATATIIVLQLSWYQSFIF